MTFKMKVQLAIFCFVVTIFSSNSEVPPCPAHCIPRTTEPNQALPDNSVPKFLKELGSFRTASGEKKTYYLSDDLKLNWIESHLTCRSYGMHLLSLVSKEDYDQFKVIFMNNAALFELHTYIGGTKMSNTNWYWVKDGKTIDTMAWGSGEPNGAHVKDYCTDLVKQGGDLVLNDLPCRATQYMFKFICERSEF